MKRNSMIAIGLALTVFAAIFLAQKSVANPPAIEGVILAVESREKHIQVADDGDEFWFRCTERTKITLNGYAASFNQLARGQIVRVVYDASTYETLEVEARSRPDR